MAHFEYATDLIQQVRMAGLVGWPQPLLIVSSNALLHVKDTVDIIWH